METTGTNYNEAITDLKQLIPKISKIPDQRKKVLELLKTDESRYLPFIVNEKEDDYNFSMFSMSQCFSAKSSTSEEFLFQKTNCCVRCTGALGYWLGVSKEEGDKCLRTVCKFMADNVTTSAFDGKKSVYEAFKNSSHSNGIDVLEYKYMFCKALEIKLMVEEMIVYNRKR
eukprot:15116960-Ditylum_brightwellii.AAC.1